jgi:hypothetical protein
VHEESRFSDKGSGKRGQRGGGEEEGQGSKGCSPENLPAHSEAIQEALPLGQLELFPSIKRTNTRTLYYCGKKGTIYSQHTRRNREMKKLLFVPHPLWSVASKEQEASPDSDEHFL